MNRVILCGRLAERSRWAYTPCGIAVAHLRLHVPRHRRGEQGEEVIDAIDCFAFRDVAGPLTLEGETGLRINLEGRLLPGVLLDENQESLRGWHVWVERVYLVEAWPDPAVRCVTSQAAGENEPTDERKVA